MQDINGVKQHFDSKVILLGNDFRKVLPIVPRSPTAVVIDTCLKRSHLWELFQQFQLTQNMRTHPGQKDFSKLLLRLGTGTLIASLRLPVRDVIEIPAACLARGSLVDDVFANTITEDRRTRVILSPKYGNSLAMNEEVIQTLGQVRQSLTSVQIH